MDSAMEPVHGPSQGFNIRLIASHQCPKRLRTIGNEGSQIPKPFQVQPHQRQGLPC